MVIGDRIRDDIRDAIPVICLLSGGTATYFGIGRATDVAEWLAENGMMILGIEGFRCDGKSIVPLLDFVADFSSLTGSESDRIEASRRASEDVLLRWSSEVEFVEFTIDA